MAATTALLLFVATLAPVSSLRAATASPAASASTAAAAASPASAAPAEEFSPKPAFIDSSAITAYLSDMLTWYRHLGAEGQLVDHPEEIIYYATDQQIAKEVLKLAFDAARGQVALNAKANPSAAEQANRSPLLKDLVTKASEADAALAKAQNHLKDLQAQLATAPKSQRAAISAQISVAKGEAELAKGRDDAVKSLLQYANGLAVADHNTTGILAQIDQMQQTVTDTEKAAKPSSLADSIAKKPQKTADGILGLASQYFSLGTDSRALGDSKLEIDDLVKKIERFRKHAGGLLAAINDRGTQLVRQAEAGDTNEIKNRTGEYQQLIDLHDLAVGVVAPLSKQEVQLALYQENLARWQASIDRYSSRALRALIVRLGTLFGLLALVIAGKYLWRRLGDRYISDANRRRQVQQFSQPVFWVLIVFVLIVNFATELGSVATIIGFGAAGVALALQNVILSVAGYFFLIGKFGIRVGDRVQIGATVGDVISIGLVKLTLMELSPQDRQPTGRVVVYSNAVVFQPNGNFFKQAPGMGFIWNEVRLTMAPDCDYRLAEKRVIDAVDEVFARYRDRVQRDFRYLEADLHVMLETPRPQSRLQLTASGLDMIVRYPADVRAAVQIADEVSRRVLDAIKREPGLKLVAPGTANIQSIELPPAPEDEKAAPKGETIAPNGGKLVSQK